MHQTLLERHGYKRANEETQDTEDAAAVGKLMRGLGGFLLPGAANTAAVVGHDITNRAVHEPFDRAAVERYMGAQGKPTYKDGGGYYANPDITPDKKHWIGLNSSSSEATLAHELGHMKNWEGRGPLMRKLMQLGYGLGAGLGPITSMAGSAYAMGSDDPSWTPAVAHTALTAPMLWEEGTASARALSGLVGEHGLGGGLRRALPLAPAFGTYGAIGLTPIAITAIRKHLASRRQEQELTVPEEKVAYALERFGYQAQQGEEPAPRKRSRSLLPGLIAGGLAAAGTYKMMRTPSFAQNATLRGLQQRGVDKGFHRVVDVSRYDLPASATVGDKVKNFLRPQVGKDGSFNAWEKAKLWAREGGEAIPVAFDPRNSNKTLLPGHEGNKVHTDGVVFNRHVGPLAGRGRRHIIGGVDYEGPDATQRALNKIEAGGKAREADLLQRYAPGAMPDTLTNVNSVWNARRMTSDAERVQAVRELKKKLDLEMAGRGSGNYMLKIDSGVASSGQFPRSNGDWGAQLENYYAHLNDTEKFKAFRQAKGHPNDFATYLKRNGLYEGHVLNQAVRNPRKVLAQRMIEKPMGELRVHTTHGAVPEDLIMARHPGSALESSMLDRQGVRQFVERDVLSKLPKNIRKGAYNLDVMPYKKPDGSVGYHVIEMNPSERGSPHSAGSASGLLDSDINPLAGHRHYKAMTGRHTDSASAAGAAAAGLGAGGLTYALTPKKREDEDESALPHPAG